jgi:small subunit ribosomal protein S4
MARDRSPIVKQSRREGFALHVKAHKVMAKKSGIPGVHAHRAMRGKASLYSLQLREKQKVRRLYGLLEKQFANTMKEAGRSKGQSGQVLLQLLERRLDNVVYRAGWSVSRRGSRQLVNHGHLMVNGTRVDIPSLRVKEGDVITVRPSSAKSLYFASLDEIVKDTNQPPLSWMKSDHKKMTITVTGLPTREEADQDINEQLIVEYYSR